MRTSRLPALLLSLVVAGSLVGTAQQPAAQPAAIALQDTIPFDAAVLRGALPNGLQYYVRRNPRPANRVAMRLAVKAGSLDEADDQQGLAHFLEHMAFNGSAHFGPGELISFFERTGARLGPHVNAYTSFDETVYMLDLPTDSADVLTRGFDALADFAGGMTIDAGQVDKERGVVVEEWRGRLGATSRIRDRQLPLLYYQSRYADRLPIGKPEILRTAPACARSTMRGTARTAWRWSSLATSIRRRQSPRSRGRLARSPRGRPRCPERQRPCPCPSSCWSVWSPTRRSRSRACSSWAGCRRSVSASPASTGRA
jgi:hypothetical protein